MKTTLKKRVKNAKNSKTKEEEAEDTDTVRTATTTTRNHDSGTILKLVCDIPASFLVRCPK